MMGEVEQLRMATPGASRVDTLRFRPDPVVERALRRAVDTAQRNLAGYLRRTGENGTGGDRDA